MNKLKVEVCVGTSCHLMGSNLILDFLEGLSEEVKDRLDISYKSCMNQCNKGPHVRIGDVEIKNAAPDDIKEELSKQLL